VVLPLESQTSNQLFSRLHDEIVFAGVQYQVQLVSIASWVWSRADGVHGILDETRPTPLHDLSNPLHAVKRPRPSKKPGPSKKKSGAGDGASSGSGPAGPPPLPPPPPPQGSDGADDAVDDGSVDDDAVDDDGGDDELVERMLLGQDEAEELFNDWFAEDLEATKVCEEFEGKLAETVAKHISTDLTLKAEVERAWAELDESLFDDPADAFQEAAVQACLGPTSGHGGDPSGSGSSSLSPLVPKFESEQLASVFSIWETAASDNYKQLMSASRITEQVSLGGDRRPWEMSLIVEPTLNGPRLRVIHWSDPLVKTVSLSCYSVRVGEFQQNA
jgi:hypothetical protein